MISDAEAAAISALHAGQSVTMRALGGSMGTSIPSGARVRIDSKRASRIGRVVAVERPDGGLALHRLVGRSGGGAITWGDGMPRPDSWSSTVILGEVRVMDSPRPRSARAALSGPARAALHVAAGVALSVFRRCISASGR